MSLSRIPRAFPASHRRSFVSTVLLSRTWESLTVRELRSEAKARGLSTQGNKSTLVARIKEHEQDSVTSPTVRAASTGVPPPKRTVRGPGPGIPLPAQSDSASTRSDFLAVRLPDLSQTSPSAPVQVPYLPNFRGATEPKANPPVELEPPRVHVVSGSATHFDGGPTHNLEKLEEDDSPGSTFRAEDPPASKEVGLWADFWESLGLPRSFSTRRTLSELAGQSVKDDFQARSRPLTGEERRGLYVLLGIVGGSWLVGGLVNRRTDAGEKHDAQKQH